MPKLDIDYVRNEFPSLSDDKTRDIAFFENAGGSYVPKQLIQSWNDFMIHNKVQPYGPYSMSIEGTEKIETATVMMAQMINANSDEVVLGHSTTMNFSMLSMSLRASFKPGDEVIVTEQDHESNVSPWLRLQEVGVNIRTWKIDPETGLLSLSDLDDLLSSKTRLVCMPHSSNVVACTNDIKTVADKVHRVNGWLLVDGVSHAPHHAIDVKALGVDIYALSLYKVFGPHLGLLYVSSELHGELQNMSLQFLPELYKKIERPGSPSYLSIALNPGLANHEEVGCLNGLVDYFDDLYQHHFVENESSFQQRVKAVYTLFEQHQQQISEPFNEFLMQLKGVKVPGLPLSQKKDRYSTWALRIDQPKAVAVNLAQQNIAVQSGSFYAFRCLQAMGVDPESGLLRISFAHFNSAEEVSRLIEALQQQLK